MGKAKKKAGEEIGVAQQEANEEVKEESSGGGGGGESVGGAGVGPAAPPPARKRGRPRKVILAVVQKAHEAAMKADESFSKEESLQKSGAESKSKKHAAESKSDLENGPPLKVSSRREGSRRKSEPKRAAH